MRTAVKGKRVIITAGVSGIGQAVISNWLLLGPKSRPVIFPRKVSSAPAGSYPESTVRWSM